MMTQTNNYKSKKRQGAPAKFKDSFKDGQPAYSEKKSYGDKPYGERKSYGDKPYGERKSYGDKPYGERKSYGDKPYGERKSYGDKPYGERKSYGDKPYGERKSYGDKPYGERKSYGDKPYGERKSYGDKPYGERKSYGDKPYGERKSYGDKPYGERKSYGDKSYGERKSYGDKSYEKKRSEFNSYENNRQSSDESAVESEEELPYFIIGRNAVKEAIKSGRSIDRILVNKEADGSLREIIGLAIESNLIIREVDKSKLDELCMPFGHSGKTGNHQGILAQVPGVEYVEISDILAAAKEKGEKPFILLVDSITDPFNLGSIIRSAECAGVHGVIIPKRRAVSVTASVSKTSAGAIEHIKIARVVNLSGAIDRLKDEGLWIAGADMSGKSVYESKLEGAIGLVIGSEGNGISKLIREKCDFLVSIPMYGNIESLNASVAASIIMFEKKHQDKR